MAAPARPVVAVVLAAGRGTRLGGRKLERAWGDSTILQTVLAKLAAAGVAERLVVAGHEAERVAAVAAAVGAGWVLNPDYDGGMLTSVQRGLASCPAGADAVIVPGDHPGWSPATVTALLAARDGRPALLIPTVGGRRGHPVVVTAELFDEVNRLDPAAGLRQLRERRPEAVRLVPVDDEGILVDVDTPEDYRARP